MGGIDGNDFSGAFEDAFKALGTVNLAIFGKTGVGKSAARAAFEGDDLTDLFRDAFKKRAKIGDNYTPPVLD